MCKNNDSECHFIEKIDILFTLAGEMVEGHGQRCDEDTVLLKGNFAVPVCVQLFNNLSCNFILHEAQAQQHACIIDLTSLTGDIWPKWQQHTIKCILTYSEQHTSLHK